MSTRQVVAEVIVGRISPAAVWIENCARVGPARAAQVEDRLARAVARQLGLRAVGVEDPQPRDEAGLVGRREHEHAVGAEARSGGSQRRRTRAGVSSNGSASRSTIR